MATDADPDFLTALGQGTGNAGVPGAGNSPDPDFVAALNAPSSPTPSVAPPSHTPIVHHAPTRFQQSVAPPTPNAPEPSWGQVAQGAWNNALPSLGGLYGSIGSAITHPGDTLNALGQLGGGALSQAAGALGMQQDPVQKAKNEALVSALEHHYATAYGSVGGFKRALMTDPASVAMDVATVLTGGGGLAAKAPGLVGKIGELAAQTGNMIDPVQTALRVASIPAGITGKFATRFAQPLRTGASADAFTRAAEAGASGDPALQAAFKGQLTGSVRPTAIVDAASDAVQQLADRRASNYLAGMQQASGGSLPTLPISPIQSAIDDARDTIQYADPQTGATMTMYPQAEATLQQIQRRLGFIANNPASQNLLGFDALKKAVGEIQSGVRNDPQSLRVATQVRNAIGDTIGAAHPDYASVMQDYSDASDQLNQMRSSFGIGKRNPDDEAILRKILTTKPGSTKETLLSQLSDINPALPYMVAGHELGQILPVGVFRRMAEGFDFPVAIMHPHMIPLIAADAMMASPRVMGSINYEAGRAANLIGKATQQGVTTPAYYAGRVEQEGAPPNQSGLMDSIKSAIWNQESGNNPNIGKSSKGAVGVGQMEPSTFKAFAWPGENINNPDDNRRVSARFIDYLEQKYNGDPARVATAYFSGEGNVAPEGSPTPWKVDTSDGRVMVSQYVRQVLGRMGGNIQATDGGRIERAAGGSVSVETLADKLMREIEAARKAETRATKPLLKEPDALVAKALAIAQKSL